jgi:hypothetical protein
VIPGFLAFACYAYSLRAGPSSISYGRSKI